MKKKSILKDFDPCEGKEIKCGLCWSKIQKGEKYWYFMEWVLCKWCHDACHVPSIHK